MKFTRLSSFRKAISSKRWLRILIEGVASLVAVLFVVLTVLLGRLAMGPINLDFLTKDVETAFNSAGLGVSATVEHTQLVWRDISRPFEIELVGVHLNKDQKKDWLKIEHVGISLRLYRLVGGDVSLKQIRFYHPQILLEREENGEFSLGIAEGGASQELSFKEIAPLLALSEGPNTSLGKLNDLNRISIIGAEIILKDKVDDLEWDLPKCTLVLKRRTGGFRVDLSLYPKEGKGYLVLGLDHKLDTSRFDFYAHFHHIAFKKLIKSERPAISSAKSENKIIDDIINFVQHWDIPLHGRAHIALHSDTLQIIDGKGNIDIAKGALDLSIANLTPLPVSSGNISFGLSPQGIELSNASLLSQEMLLHFSGKLYSENSPLHITRLLEQGQTIEFKGKIEDLLLNHLGAIWPQDVAKHARDWITENVKTGTLTEADFVLKGSGSDKGLIVDDLKGFLKGNNIELTYINGLPHAEHITAESTFDKQGFDIKILSGEVKGVKVKDGQVLIKGLDGNNESLSLLLKGTGPLPDILDIIDHKPLEYASYGEINPKKSKGNAEFDLKMSFPLVHDLTFKDVKMDLKGTLKKVEIERQITPDLKATVKDGNFTVDLTHEQMIIEGKGVLNKLLSNLRYKHDFRGTKPYQLKIEIGTTATFDDFSRFGFDYRDYAKGSAGATLTFTLEHDKKSRLIVDLDTTPSTLVFPPLQWEKKAGEKGNISFALVFKDGQLSKMKEIEMTSPTYKLKGDILFGQNKTWNSVHLSEFKGPHMDTEVTLQTIRDNAYEATFKGKLVDVEKFLEYVEEGSSDKEHHPTDITLKADVDELRMGEGKVFKSVQATADLFLHGKDHTWKQVHLRAKAGEGTAHKGEMAQVSGGISFDIKPGDNNTRLLEVRANDAGQFLKNLSIYEEIQGGYITIKAKRVGQGPYVGVFKLKEFNANEIPLLARFAAMLSPMGIANLFSENKTISMDRFESNFEFSDALIVVKNGIGKSISLGFTVEGKLDRMARTFALKGNIIPARFINSILNNIPILGPLIQGGEGEGLFAIAYSVTGKFEKPEISLNPLSALAPGFIRKLFQSIGSDDD